MAAYGGCLTELPVHKEKELKPLRLVRCMVKYPCGCACASLSTALITTIIGFQILIGNAGPLGPFKIGLDYPNQHIIAKNSDALTLAVEDSKLARLGSDAPARRGGFGRRLELEETSPADAEPATMWDGILSGKYPLLHLGVERMLGAQLAHDMKLPPSLALDPDGSHGRALAAKQEQQTETLAIALLVVAARKGVDNLYDDAGLAQLCRFRKGLMDDVDTWKDYCLMVDDPEYEASGDAPNICDKGTDVMSMFYGDADYDLDEQDLDIFDIKDFDDIVDAFKKQDWSLLMDFDATERQKVTDFYLKMFGYLTGAWNDKRYVCDKEYKKDVPKTLKLLAKVREQPSLDVFNGVLNQYFDKNFTVANPKTLHTKGFYSYGAPLEGFDNYIEQAQKEKQDAQYQLWWAEKRFRLLYPEGPSALWPTGQPTILNTALILSEILGVLIGDGIRAVAPIIFVTCVVWLQTGSLLIGLVTIIECIFSITCAIFVTAGILQIKWISFQVPLSLYIVLAIGADDVFVFMDAYKQSFYRGPVVNQDLTHRMTWVFKRAGLAMLITSLTTCSAFIASALSSPIPELQNFGIFAAFVIFIDYMLVMTFLCSNCIFFHNYFEMKPGFCCACCDGCCADWRCAKGGCKMLCTFGSANLKTTTQIAAEQGAAITEAVKPFAVRFFEDAFPFNAVVKNTKTRIASIVVFFVFFIVSITNAVRIEPQKSTENFLPDDHPFQRYNDVNNAFNSSNFDSTVEINFVWGLKNGDPLDQTGVNLIFDGDFKGKPNYQSGFEMTEKAQNALMSACAVLKAAETVKVEIDAESGNSTILVSCWIEAFKKYREFKDAAFPVPSADSDKAISDWLDDPNEDELIPADALVRSTGGSYEGDIGWTKEGDKLKVLYTKLRASSKINTRAFLPSQTTRIYYAEWQEVLDDVNKKTKNTELGRAFQASGTGSGLANKWIYMTVQEAYVSSAITGAVVGLVIATFVLLLATKNFLMTITCMGTIVAALICVIGTIVSMGWELGSNESLCIMVLCGFAVDYVVHLSHAYMESPAKARLDRVHDALRDLGISVFWGMLTSIISATTLTTCSIQSLSKFGVFFALTIAYAYLWSMFFLMPLLAFIGPEPKVGATYTGEASATKSADGSITHVA